MKALRKVSDDKSTLTFHIEEPPDLQHREAIIEQVARKARDNGFGILTSPQPGTLELKLTLMPTKQLVGQLNGAFQRAEEELAREASQAEQGRVSQREFYAKLLGIPVDHTPDQPLATKEIVQVSSRHDGGEEANKYLKLGWTLLGLWIDTKSHDGAEGEYQSQVPWYLFVWENENKPAVHPPDSFAARMRG